MDEEREKVGMKWKLFFYFVSDIFPQNLFSKLLSNKDSLMNSHGILSYFSSAAQLR